MVNAPRPSTPPLRALRAFEAAARHSSFVKAAEELAVTPGAIAQQVRLLENWLGQPLFIRSAHGITPTANTKLVLKQLTTAFDELSRTVQSLRAISLPDQVRIATMPSIALLWLSTRLSGLQKRFPELEISVSALDEPPNFKRELFDIGLFYCDEVPSDTVGTVVLVDTLSPVCVPSLDISSLSDLTRHALLHDASWENDWERWLAFVGAKEVAPNRGPVFSLYSVALQSALDGRGVLMGRTALVQKDIANGRLVRPFPIEAPGDKLYVLIPAGRELPPSHLELARALNRYEEL